MTINKQKLISAQVLLLGATCIGASQGSEAQVAESADGEDALIEEVITVGTHIKGADVAGTLPVTVLEFEDIEITGAESGDELLRSIPQIGEVSFNDSVTTGVNDARGDVGSINLRGLGAGNTLTLINGRRMVLHPGTKTVNFVPVVTANSNTLPVRGLRRVEVLRDGASAIYGTDAVAGVINYVLKEEQKGTQFSVRYGGEEGTQRDEFDISGATGLDFNGGRTHLTLSGSYSDRTGVMASEKAYSASSDLRPFVEGDPLFEGDTNLRGTSSSHGWGVFEYDGGFGRAHTQPASFSSCDGAISDTVCFDASSSSTGGNDLRVDRNPARSLVSDRTRLNLFGMGYHELANGVEVYAEGGYYRSESERVREAAAILSNARIEVPADYYWNPLGPVTFADGRVNPNRLPGLDPAEVPVEGLSFRLRTFRPLDAGPRIVEVENTSYRFLTGLRGEWNNWEWDTAVLYSEAKTVDSTNRVSTSLFQQSLMLDTPEAYNLFSGVDPDDPSSPFDPTPNPRDIIDRFMIQVDRVSETSLALADFKVSNMHVYDMPAGSVGFAAGLEWREETINEDRSRWHDGSTPFVDAITGEQVNRSDIMGSSFSPDAEGGRRVTSLYGELLVPLLADLPLITSLDMQIAARFESFSDVGDVFKPKLALSWYLTDWLQVRSAYSEGFRAPNLLQVHQGRSSFVNSRDDFALADPVSGDVPRYSMEEVRFGNEDLEPEENENVSVGLVLTPLEGLTVTADAWRIKQDGLVGIFGGQNHVNLDALLREQGGFNPAVVREQTNDGSLGEVLLINDRYTNLDLRTIEGFDFSIMYNIESSLGEFDFKLNGAKLLKFDQIPSADGQSLVDAGFETLNAGSLIEREFRPKWRGNLSARWRYGPWGAGIFANYVGKVFDIQTLADDDTADPGAPLPVDSFVTVNVSGDYRFQAGFAKDTRIRLGVNNVLNEDPPLADEPFGYEGSLHSNRGRYIYTDVRVKF